jgi:hypothetical protein
MDIKYWHNYVQIEGRKIVKAGPLFIIGNQRRRESWDKRKRDRKAGADASVILSTE